MCKGQCACERLQSVHRISRDAPNTAFLRPTAPLGRLTARTLSEVLRQDGSPELARRRGVSSFDRAVSSGPLAFATNAAVYGFSIVTNCCRGTCRPGRVSVANGRTRQPPLLSGRTRHRPPGSALQPYEPANLAFQMQPLHLGSGEVLLAPRCLTASTFK